MARSVTVAACILGGAAVAWLVVLRQADGMQSAPGTMGLGVVAFLGLWLAMMAAMMLPALAPLGVMLAGEREGRCKPPSCTTGQPPPGSGTPSARQRQAKLPRLRRLDPALAIYRHREQLLPQLGQGSSRHRC